MAFTTSPIMATVCVSDGSSSGSATSSAWSTETEALSTDAPVTPTPSLTKTEAPLTNAPCTPRTTDNRSTSAFGFQIRGF
ncbi:hypothetical protein P3T76_009643 [Phytophthora citrophthora]|uniref:Uncharacterized protein n=1 Tax=Phytophthora citrophthora TaxID=4793 RepID=A0AAD9GH05_9STRA|nr:hypothetical protein P3T76_009643 [Phytophthora citrophthora]